MIVGCPHCQARLNLPVGVEGKQVLCPICRQVFRADEDVLKESVQAGSPESAPAFVSARPRLEDDRRRVKTRRLDEDGDGDPLDSHGFSPDSVELIENAKSQTRPAAYLR